MEKSKKRNFDKLRDDFPILSREVHPGKKIVYLDSAATSQKPHQVIESLNRYYRETNSNIHRGVHVLAEEATAAYETARMKVVRFIGGDKPQELVFTRNTTESINLVAQTWGRRFLKKGDTIILTEMEHHSNLVPWQLLSEEIGIILEFIPITDGGQLDLAAFDRLLALEPKLVSFMQMSNVLGTINPAQEIIQKAHQVGAVTLVDAAQSVPHYPVSIMDLDADFLAFSAHKMLGPTGIGALWGREKLLKEMPPFMGGGDMIKKVFLRSFTPNDLPYKFEAGTPAIAEAIGFGAAIDYLEGVGMAEIAAHERNITRTAIDRLKEIRGLHILGPEVERRGGVISFTLDSIHPHDVAQILDSEGIAVRAGHHCAMPLHDRYKIPASSRASFYLYNSDEDVDKLVTALLKVKKIFG